MNQFDARYTMPFAERHIGPRQEDLAAMLSVIGVMVETIVIMAAYSLVIVKKYEEK